nr:MAG: hypothetical protein [uncultured archaeon]
MKIDKKKLREWIYEVSNYIDRENSSCRYSCDDLQKLAQKIFDDEYPMY